MPGIQFDSSVHVELQLNDYSCSVGATYWCLRALGVDLTQEALEALMVPGLVSPALGLLDGSGATIVTLLQQHFGLSASNVSPTNFDAVAARAGKQPVAIGGACWVVGADGSAIGHWVGVRSFDGAQLVLANPGGTGPNFGQQTLTRADFDQRAPFAVVWIDAAPAAPAWAANGPTFLICNTDGQGANVRSQPSTEANVVASFQEGAMFIGARNAWRAVTDPTGTRGWVADEYVTSSTNGAFQVANTNGTGANLRSQPGTDATSIKVLPDGTALTGDAHAWRQVADSGTTTGWIAAEFLSVVAAD